MGCVVFDAHCVQAFVESRLQTNALQLYEYCSFSKFQCFSKFRFSKFRSVDL